MYTDILFYSCVQSHVGFFGPKHVVENYRINFRVLTGFIAFPVAQMHHVDELL